MKTYRHYVTLLLLSSITLQLAAQSQDQNYIKTTVYKQPYTDVNSLPANPTLEQATVQIGYYDGLGRPLQNVAVGQSHSGKDIVTPMAYDAFGRQDKEYLPYATGMLSGNYYPEALTDVLGFYNNATYDNTQNPYSQKLFENSPLDRVLKQAAPGNDWALGGGHEIKFGYDTNVANEVRLFQVTTTWLPSVGLYNILLNAGTDYYPPSQLYKNTTIDENTTATTADRTEEYKDKEGRVVLKRVWARIGGFDSAQPPVLETHDTYYVYDIYGNLTYVLPPAVDTSGEITTDMLTGLCYQYKYDQRNRLVAKKLPGKTWEYIVYDKLDRVRATGPVNAPFTDATGSGWLFTKYDAFNRPVMTAWQAASTFSEAARKTLQNAIDANTNLNEQKATANVTFNTVVHRYTNVSYPTTNYHILTLTYYDDYAFPNAPTTFTDVLGQPVRQATAGNCKGLVTGSWVRVLETTAMSKANLTTTLYKNDRSATPIRTKTLYLYNGDGYTQTDTETNFQGQVLHTETRHKRLSSSTELMVKENFTYAPQGRLLTHTHQVNSNPIETLTANDYDELGQLITKKVGRTTDNPLQTLNYTYNIRGWLTDINHIEDLDNDLFAFGLRYNSGLQPGSTALYNGNIAETHWKSTQDLRHRMYRYNYDGLNRLTQAHYTNIDVNNTLGNYNESLTYDKNGNIQALQRNGFEENIMYNIPIDNLKYFYDANNKNVLKKVVDLTNSAEGFKDDGSGTEQSDTADDYEYDQFGNMTKDQNKHITSISYNHLNLPLKINFDTGSYITYLYDATGVKTKKTVYTYSATAPTSAVTEYLGAFQYTSKAGSGVELQFIFTAEGYYNVVSFPTSGGIVGAYVYNYTDHLGNIRLSYTLDQATQEITPLEEHHYYPFGLEHKYYNSTRKTYDKQEEEVTLADGSKIAIVRPVVVQVPNSGYQYQYNGKEWQDELGLNIYDYGNRNYDAAIGRFFNMDRLSEKYKELTPFHYTANNPVYFVDVKGDSINVADLYRKDKKGEFVNKSRVEAFEFFANTKEGKTFLSQFASKGQNVAGVTFDADGKFHKAGIDLNYDTNMSKYNQYAEGETSTEFDSNDRLQISVSLQTNSIYSMIETITHESFIHAERYGVDFINNRKLDSSNIDKDIKEDYKPVSWQHIQERRDAYNKKSRFWKYGYTLLINANKKYKQFKSNEEIYNDMWGFRN